jgi:hypothetical protein
MSACHPIRAISVSKARSASPNAYLSIGSTMPFVTIPARIYSDNTGAYSEIPVILTPVGPLEPLVDYCLARYDRSLSWMRKLVSAVGVFLDYLEANPDEREQWLLFRNFAHALYMGTYDVETGLDPSGLCWEARPHSTVGYIVVQLSEFFDWLGKDNPAAAKLNPRYLGGTYDKRVDQAAYLYRRSKSFLGHTWAENPSTGRQGRVTRTKRGPKVEGAPPPDFPDDRFEELLFKGFLVAGRHDFRGMLITLLMHGAGFRVSEPFHLYVADVAPNPLDPSSALVRIHDPELGVAPDGWRNQKGKVSNRRAYLAARWAMQPRGDSVRNEVGWKDNLLDGNYYMEARWFDPVYGKWFLQIWALYMKQVAMLDRDHPFAFVNLHRAPVGGMYSLQAFKKAHKEAVLRIGLPYGKEHGTTEHGHRHSYAQRLRRAGISPLMIKGFMHHKSLESQVDYTRPTPAESRDALAAAAQRMQQTGRGSLLPEIFTQLQQD